MLIFVMPTSYPNPDNPVANLFVAEQVSALAEIESNRIVVLNVRKQPSKKLFTKVDYAIHETEENGILLISIKHKTFIEDRLVLLNQVGFTKAMRKLYRFACERYGTPDVIFAHFFSAGLTALELTKNDKVPVVVMEHSGVIMSEKLDFRKKKILQRVVEDSYAYLATTDNLRNHVIKHTNTKKTIKVVPNLVNDAFVFSTHKREQFVFFSLSRLEADKCVGLLIEAFCEAFGKDDKVCLRIGGDGTEYEKLQKSIACLRRDHQVFLLGRLDRAESVNEMKNCDAFALPSRHETFGLVWREALCAGRPVITTEHGGFGPSDWKQSYGYMIPVDDLDALVSALKNMYSCYDTFELKTISDENRVKYSPESVSSQLMEIFKAATDSKGK